MAYRRIVVATDGSASAETAEHVAATLAAALGAKLTIAHAYANPDRAGDAVERAEKIAEREGALHEVALSAEAPADAILMTASQTDTELIVIGSTGLSASEQLFGSVSRRVVTHAPSDVLLTRARPDDQRPHGAPPYRRLLIATDGSSTADRAARKGYALAKRLKASVTLLFVGSPQDGRARPAGHEVVDRRRGRRHVGDRDPHGRPLRRDRRRGRERGLRPRGDRQPGPHRGEGRPAGFGPARRGRERPVRRPGRAHRRPEPVGDRARRGRHRQDRPTTRWRSTGTRRATSRRCRPSARTRGAPSSGTRPSTAGSARVTAPGTRPPARSWPVRPSGRSRPPTCSEPEVQNTWNGLKIINQVIASRTAAPNTAFHSATGELRISSSSSSLRRGTPEGRTSTASFTRS